MSELQQYYDACKAGMFEREGDDCPCRNGWFLSEVDTWHKCPGHYDGQPDPEWGEPEDWDVYHAAKAKAEASA